MTHRKTHLRVAVRYAVKYGGGVLVLFAAAVFFAHMPGEPWLGRPGASQPSAA
jgi:hypothetical protein